MPRLFDFVPPSTPALVVDAEALRQNLAAMQAACDAAGVRLRAHGKMHKCSAIGRMQVELGAVGLCAQTVGEAEAFVAAGVPDVLVTSPPAVWGAPRLAELGRTGARLATVADDLGQIERLGAAASTAGVTLGLVIDLDLGLRRTGAYPRDAEALARAAASTPGLRYDGIQAYLGHLQHHPDLEVRRRKGAEAAAELAGVVETLTRADLAPPVVTGGGTGTFASDFENGVYTELQAGSYAFMDVEYEDCGPPGGGAWPFRQALYVVASVVSARHKSHVTVDAGLKAFSVDGPAARPAAGAPAGARWSPMGDEHGAIVHPAMTGGGSGGDRLAAMAAIAQVDADPAIPWPADAPKVGELVWLQPGHCDPTVNLYDALWLVEPDGTASRLPIDARRRTGEAA